MHIGARMHACCKRGHVCLRAATSACITRQRWCTPGMASEAIRARLQAAPAASRPVVANIACRGRAARGCSCCSCLHCCCCCTCCCWCGAAADAAAGEGALVALMLHRRAGTPHAALLLQGAAAAANGARRDVADSIVKEVAKIGSACVACICIIPRNRHENGQEAAGQPDLAAAARQPSASASTASASAGWWPPAHAERRGGEEPEQPLALAREAGRRHSTQAAGHHSSGSAHAIR